MRGGGRAYLRELSLIMLRGHHKLKNMSKSELYFYLEINTCSLQKNANSEPETKKGMKLAEISASTEMCISSSS